MSPETLSLIATFATSHGALRAEREIKALGIAVELIPVPREIASDCGFCLLFPGIGDRLEGAAMEVARGLGKEGLWSVSETRTAESGKKERRYERIA